MKKMKKKMPMSNKKMRNMMSEVGGKRKPKKRRKGSR